MLAQSIDKKIANLAWYLFLILPALTNLNGWLTVEGAWNCVSLFCNTKAMFEVASIPYLLLLKSWSIIVNLVLAQWSAASSVLMMMAAEFFKVLTFILLSKHFEGNPFDWIVVMIVFYHLTIFEPSPMLQLGDLFVLKLSCQTSCHRLILVHRPD